MFVPFTKDDRFFMKHALVQAYRALEHDEVPVGAIVVSPKGIIIGRGYNQVEKQGCQIAHAEMLAIQEACKHIGDWRLDGHWVYVTLEPCSMCMSFIKLSRVAGVVYGAESPLFGYHLDKDAGLRVYNKNTVQIVRGICAEESVSLLKRFFQNKRKKVNEDKRPSWSKGALEAIKKKLLARKQELEEQLTNLSTEEISDGQVQDVGDQTLSSIMESLRTSIQDAEVDEYRRIVRAIEMINEGTYGICADCRQGISEKRLKPFPNAVRCLSCQELFEENIG